MNWLELDKVRNGHTTRMRRKPPDPNIGDHLPPPVARNNPQETPSVQSSSGFSPGQMMQYANFNPLPTQPQPQPQPASPSSYATASPGDDLQQNSPSDMRVYGRPRDENIHLSLASHSPIGGNLQGFNATRQGNGRLSYIISEMKTIASDQHDRVLNLKGAAVEASNTHGDSLDQLLQEFAGGIRQPLQRGAQSTYPTRTEPYYAPAVVLPQPLPQTEFTGTMVHTTEIVGRVRNEYPPY